VVRQGYWDVEDGQVMAKMGKPLAHWMKVLDRFGAATKRATECVDLRETHEVSRYWARTLMRHYLKGGA
jgi:hypothetical protein